ncbi:MAG: cellulase family glycosylhydrolase [Ruminococcus callidus]
MPELRIVWRPWQYVLDNRMYAVVNLHWDNGWIASSPPTMTPAGDTPASGSRYRSAFGYGDHLILESMNEEGCFDDLWNHYSVRRTARRSIRHRQPYQPKFVDLVRSSGGNNPERHLLIAGYATDVDMTCDEMFQMPEDSGRSPCRYIIIRRHVLHPGGRRLGQGKDHLGSPRDQRILEKDMEKLQTRFLDNGIRSSSANTAVPPGTRPRTPSGHFSRRWHVRRIPVGCVPAGESPGCSMTAAAVK